MDKATFGGILVGIGGILAGLLIEGGSLTQIMQPTAAIIVLGGTLGAVLIQFPLPVVMSAFRRLAHVFFEPKNDPQSMIQEVVRFANKARREGIVALDADVQNVEEPFRRRRRKEHVSHERWLVSYADLITLLFAFFVVMYSTSQVDHRKVGKLAAAIQVAF